MCYHTNEYFASYFVPILNHLIKQEGITQTELAKRMDTSKTTISRYVNGNALPNYYTLFRLSRALNCSVDIFFPPNTCSRKKHVL